MYILCISHAYAGPTIKVVEDGLLRDIKVIPSLAKVQFSQSVMEAFSTLFPPPRLDNGLQPNIISCVQITQVRSGHHARLCG